MLILQLGLQLRYPLVSFVEAHSNSPHFFFPQLHLLLHLAISAHHFLNLTSISIYLVLLAVEFGQGFLLILHMVGDRLLAVEESSCCGVTPLFDGFPHNLNYYSIRINLSTSIKFWLSRTTSSSLSSSSQCTRHRRLPTPGGRGSSPCASTSIASSPSRTSRTHPTCSAVDPVLPR